MNFNKIIDWQAFWGDKWTSIRLVTDKHFDEINKLVLKRWIQGIIIKK